MGFQNFSLRGERCPICEMRLGSKFNGGNTYLCFEARRQTREDSGGGGTMIAGGGWWWSSLRGARNWSSGGGHKGAQDLVNSVRRDRISGVGVHGGVVGEVRGGEETSEEVLEVHDAVSKFSERRVPDIANLSRPLNAVGGLAVGDRLKVPDGLNVAPCLCS